MKRRPKTWNKYNIKSLKVPHGKEGSEMYALWLKTYGKKEADRLYTQFKYQIAHGH